MPVIGHAFVGVGTAILTHPRDRAPAGTPGGHAVALWVPVLLALAYLPDLVSQLTLVTGWENARELGHSLLFAGLASLGLGPPLAQRVGDPPLRGFAIVLGSILGHDLLDVLQSTDRMPLWPFSQRIVGPGWELIPDRMLYEAAIFGTAFAVLVGFRWAVAGANPLHLIDDPRADPADRLRLRMGWFLAGLLTLGAAALNVRKNVREEQLNEAVRLVESGRYAEGLSLLEDAQKWPGRPAPGRVDYLKAEAAYGVGDRPRAEEHYRRSYAADPDYFWLVGDMAAFYAEGPGTPEERRRRAAPFVERLRTEFSELRELPAQLARIESKLNEGTGTPEQERTR
jgi:membrane-bound metal-dependent hydrolase YbcI (DUF457 family)